MSGSVASRYIGGVPYGPGMSVGRFPNAASVGAMPGVQSGLPVLQQRPVDMSGAITPVSGAGTQAVGGGGGGGGGEGNLLASLLLAGLGAAPDIYRAGRDLLGGETYYGPDENVFDPMGSFMGPGGVAIPNAALGGFGSDWGRVFEPGTMSSAPNVDRLLDMTPLAEGESGGILSPSGAGGSLDPGAATSGLFAGQGTDFGLTGTLGTVPGFGDVALGLADAAGGAAGYYGSQTAVNSRNPNSGYGQRIGSTIGGIAGSFIPVPFIGTAVGSMMGGAIGAELGDSMGAPPTIGRNFSSIGTFTGNGGIGWGNAGGDNGGEAGDATGFANWFGGALGQQAAQQGLAFNPNMAGAQFRIGGYDNFARNAQTPGGYFYTPDTGGSPENYALRPSSDFNNDAYSPGQANAFTRNVLADLTARGVFTQAGAAQPGMDFWNASQGAPLGWYGNEGPESYGAIEYGGTGGFDNVLAGRQGAIVGWQNAQQEQQQREAMFAQQQQEMAAGNPWGGAGVDAGLIDPGLFGDSYQGGTA